MSANYPPVKDPDLVGSYPAKCGAGGGFVWDAVLEYRVWCHPERGAEDLDNGSDYYYSFATQAEAQSFSDATRGAEAPLALVLHEEFLDEPEPGQFVHRTGPRLTEWPLDFLSRPRRTARTIPDFLAPDAPPNRLHILRGKA